MNFKNGKGFNRFKNNDKKWIEDFLSMPNDYQQKANEAKLIILNNRQFGKTRQIKYL